jgi:non-canonical (house-cleaning) NTP pyrophosphatase
MSDRIALSASYAHSALSVAKLEATKQEANQIDEQMDIARAKADQAMESASTGMWIGIAAGLVSAGAGVHASVASSINQDAVSKKAEEADSQSSTAKDHRSHIRDAISDLLQKIAEMNHSSKVG